MKSYIGLFVILFFLYSCASGQLSLTTAKDKDYNSIAYELTYDYSGTEARKVLEARGYQHFSSQPASFDSNNIKSGFYVVVRCIRKQSDGKVKIAYGLGGSKISYEIAEKKAVKNLSVFDWGWSEKNGYNVIEKNTFNLNGIDKCVIVIALMTKDAEGNTKVFNTCYLNKSMSDEEYRKFRAKLPKSTANQELYATRLKVSSGKVAIAKCIKVSETGIVTESIKLVYSPDGTDFARNELYYEETRTQPNESNKYFMFREIDLNVQDPCFYDERKNEIKQDFEINKTNKKTPPKVKKTFGSIRG